VYFLTPNELLYRGVEVAEALYVGFPCYYLEVLVYRLIIQPDSTPEKKQLAAEALKDTGHRGRMRRSL